MTLRTISARTLASLLRSLGFEEDRSKDHIFFYLKFQNKIIVRTKISHGNSEIGQPLLGLIGKQLHLNRSELTKLLQGQTNRAQYEKLLHTKGIC